MNPEAFRKPKTSPARPVSMCVPAWNEAPALKRLILSSLPAADLIREWIVVDHRSTNDTPGALEALRPALSRAGITLRVIREARDFSATFSMADLRNECLRACTAPVVGMMDADFILGSKWRDTLNASVKLITRSNVAGVQFPIPVVWDHLRTDAEGVITSHGRVWVHSPLPRIMRRAGLAYKQTSGNGRWEVPHFPKGRSSTKTVANDGAVLVSVNVKPQDRIALRATMTAFLEDVRARRVTGEWLTEYERGPLRTNTEYVFNESASLVGVRVHAPGLEVTA